MAGTSPAAYRCDLGIDHLDDITLSDGAAQGRGAQSRLRGRLTDRQHRRRRAEPWVLCRAFAGELAVSRARLGPGVTEPAAGGTVRVSGSSRFLLVAVEFRGPRPITR